MTSWRDAGFDDKDGRTVRNWVISKINAAERSMESRQEGFPSGLEDRANRPESYQPANDAEFVRLSEERAKWQALLDGIDQGDARGFLKAHAEWTKANRAAD